MSGCPRATQIAGAAQPCAEQLPAVALPQQRWSSAPARRTLLPFLCASTVPWPAASRGSQKCRLPRVSPAMTRLRGVHTSRPYSMFQLRSLLSPCTQRHCVLSSGGQPLRYRIQGGPAAQQPCSSGARRVQELPGNKAAAAGPAQQQQLCISRGLRSGGAQGHATAQEIRLLAGDTGRSGRSCRHLMGQLSWRSESQALTGEAPPPSPSGSG